MEAMGYAVGAADLCAAGVAAPHIRQRLYWVAYAAGARALQREQSTTDSAVGRLPDATQQHGAERGRETPEHRRLGAWSDYELWFDLSGKARRIESSLVPLVDGIPGRVGLLRGYGNAIVPQLAAAFLKSAGVAAAAEHG